MGCIPATRLSGIISRPVIRAAMLHALALSVTQDLPVALSAAEIGECGKLGAYIQTMTLTLQMSIGAQGSCDIASQGQSTSLLTNKLPCGI